MKVGIVVPYSWSYWGGVPEHAHHQARALRRLGVETRTLMGHDPPGRLTRLLHPARAAKGAARAPEGRARRARADGGAPARDGGRPALGPPSARQGAAVGGRNRPARRRLGG